MNKQEKIQESYGRNFKLCNPDKNGYFNVDKLDLMSFPNLLDLEYCPLKRMHRPKSLNGIEDNKGWIKIESESDLPELQERYFVVKNDGGIIQVFFYGKASNWIGNITHYQPIIKPEPPIY